MSLILSKRQQQGVFEALASSNRIPGSGGGSGLFSTITSGGLQAGGNQGGYSTVNSSTWTDITNTTFTLTVPRACFFDYRIFTTGTITAGAAQGYVRGNIVNFDVTASPWYAGNLASNGFIWYYPVSKGPIQPGNYTVKLQAATDNNTTTLTVNQFFHQVFLFSAG